ncbi:acylphosphatase [bacterium]|nr:acylphosphatase [bacterium]
MNKELNLNISGRVQGVYFRVYAEKEANKLGLNGYVKNEGDGSVSIVAQGNKDKLDLFFEWAKHGPNMAYVKKIKMTLKDTKKDYKNFTIIY